jgi:hypothetical protein
MKLLSSYITTLAIGSLTLFSGVAHAAGNGILSLSPASSTEDTGSILNIGVYENGNGSPVNYVDSVLTYDASQLQFESASCTGDFSSSQGVSGGNGTVNLSCFTPGGSTAPTGSANAALVTFKVLGGSGSTSITFASSSVQASAGTNIWDGSSAGATFTLATPVVTKPSTPAPVKTSVNAANSASSKNNVNPSTQPSTNTSSVLGSSTNSNGSSTTNSSNISKPSTEAAPKSSTNKKLAAKSSSRAGFVDYTSGILIVLIAAFIVTRLLTARRLQTVAAGASVAATKPKSSSPKKNASKKTASKK